jgi:hypothetical protein
MGGWMKTGIPAFPRHSLQQSADALFLIYHRDNRLAPDTSLVRRKFAVALLAFFLYAPE